MHIANLKAIIEEKFSWDKFQELITDECCTADAKRFSEETGLEIGFVDSYRDLFEPSSYHWVFNINGKNYLAYGSYDSWDGVHMDSIEDFYEVEPYEVTVKKWRVV